MPPGREGRKEGGDCPPTMVKVTIIIIILIIMPQKIFDAIKHPYLIQREKNGDEENTF